MPTRNAIEAVTHKLTLMADIIQMMYGSERDIKYDEPEVENVA